MVTFEVRARTFDGLCRSEVPQCPSGGEVPEKNGFWGSQTAPFSGHVLVVFLQVASKKWQRTTFESILQACSFCIRLSMILGRPNYQKTIVVGKGDP